MFLVTGATGNVGGELVRALAEAGAAGPGPDPRRRSAGVPARGRSGRRGPERPGQPAPGPGRREGVFLLPGYADMAGVLAEARRAGVATVVQLSGMSAGSGDLSNAITRYMAGSEQAVRECGLDWTILRPAAFMSNTFQWLPQLRAGDVVRAPFARVPRRDDRPGRRRRGSGAGADRARACGPPLRAERPAAAAPPTGCRSLARCWAGNYASRPRATPRRGPR